MAPGGGGHGLGCLAALGLQRGQCGGVASALAGMSDFVVMSKNGALFVNGPQVVSAVSGKQVDMDELAGCAASMKSGVASLTAETDESAIASARELISMLPVNNMDEAIGPCADDLNRESPDLNHIEKLADARDLISRVADEGRFFELSADFAASMVTGFGRVNGATVGFVANQNSKDEGRLTVYGCKKAARFVHFCDSFSIPVVTVVDSMGMKVSAAPQGELSRALYLVTAGISGSGQPPGQGVQVPLLAHGQGQCRPLQNPGRDAPLHQRVRGSDHHGAVRQAVQGRQPLVFPLAAGLHRPPLKLPGREHQGRLPGEHGQVTGLAPGLPFIGTQHPQGPSAVPVQGRLHLGPVDRSHAGDQHRRNAAAHILCQLPHLRQVQQFLYQRLHRAPPFVFPQRIRGRIR